MRPPCGALISWQGFTSCGVAAADVNDIVDVAYAGCCVLML
jgi:hypothetical protein